MGPAGGPSAATTSPTCPGLDYDPPAWFGRDAPLILEIGSGMGESTAALAAAEPDVDHLAVEVFEPGHRGAAHAGRGRPG